MKAALAILVLLFVPLAHGASLGASPSHLIWEDAREKSLLLFNPEPYAQEFEIIPSSGGIFYFSEMSGTLFAGESRQIKVRPRALRSSESTISVSIKDQNSFFEPSLTLRATTHAPPPITASMVGILSGLPAKAALIAIGSLVIAWCYLRLRKK